MKEFVDFIKTNKSFLIVGVVISCLYILPLLQAGVLYQDDHDRILLGYGWSDETGRFQASTIMRFLSLGKIITPIFPYSLILAAVVTFFAGVIVSYTLFPSRGMIAKLSSLLLLTSPFFLSNLSFQFDSVPMALSVLLAVFPFLFLNQRWFFVVSVASLFLVFELYQTSAMIYPAMLACVLIKENIEKKRVVNIRLILVSGCAFIVALLLFKMHLSLVGMSTPRGALIPLGKNTLSLLQLKLEGFRKLYSSLVGHGAFIKLALLFLFMSVGALIVFLCKSPKNIIHAVAIAVYFLVIIFFSMQPDLFINNPWFATAKTMLVYPFLLYALICVSASIKGLIFSRVYSFAIGLIVFYSFVFSAHHGMVLKNNNEYVEFIASTVSYEIMKDSPEELPIVAISGTHPLPNKNWLTYQKFPLILRTQGNTMDHHVWSVMFLSKYIPVDVTKRWETQEYTKEKCEMDILTKTSIYYLRKRDNVYVVDFSYKECEDSH